MVDRQVRVSWRLLITTNDALFQSDNIIQLEVFHGLEGKLQRALIADTKPHFEIVSVRFFDPLDPAPLS